MSSPPEQASLLPTSSSYTHGNNSNSNESSRSDNHGGASAKQLHALEVGGKEEPPSRSEKRVTLFCVDLSRLSPMVQLVVLSLGVFGLFMANGFVEEYTFKQMPEHFEFPMYLTVFELSSFSFFAVLERLLVRRENPLSHAAPLRYQWLVACTMTLSRGLTNVSLDYLSYPTQVVFKSLKLATVMLGSIVILRKSFTLKEYFAAGLLMGSALLFSLGDMQASLEFSGLGVTIVALSLVGDSLHANTQEFVLSKKKATVSETLVYSNLFSAIVCLAYTAWTGELSRALEFCAKYPFLYTLFLARGFCIFVGVAFFLTLVKCFDAVVANTVTTIRKVLTVVLSFFVFPKPLATAHVAGIAAFSCGVWLNLKALSQKHASKKKSEED